MEYWRKWNPLQLWDLMGRYEIQILDSYGKSHVGSGDCGGIYRSWVKNDEGKYGGVGGHAPRVNASLAPGGWQTFDIWFKAPRFDKKGNKTFDAEFVKVMQNGKVLHENVKVPLATRGAHSEKEVAEGSIKIQGDHGPVAFRNFWVLPQ